MKDLDPKVQEMLNEILERRGYEMVTIDDLKDLAHRISEHYEKKLEEAFRAGVIWKNFLSRQKKGRVK